jgi:hypothetical protein
MLNHVVISVNFEVDGVDTAEITAFISKMLGGTNGKFVWQGGAGTETQVLTQATGDGNKSDTPKKVRAKREYTDEERQAIKERLAKGKAAAQAKKDAAKTPATTTEAPAPKIIKPKVIKPNGEPIEETGPVHGAKTAPKVPAKISIGENSADVSRAKAAEVRAITRK